MTSTATQRTPAPYRSGALIWVGEMHIVEIIAVTRGWLESVAKGEHPEVKVDTYAVAR
jgi:hypothetical protein